MAGSWSTATGPHWPATTAATTAGCWRCPTAARWPTPKPERPDSGGSRDEPTVDGRGRLPPPAQRPEGVRGGVAPVGRLPHGTTAGRLVAEARPGPVGQRTARRPGRPAGRVARRGAGSVDGAGVGRGAVARRMGRLADRPSRQRPQLAGDRNRSGRGPATGLVGRGGQPFPR